MNTPNQYSSPQICLNPQTLTVSADVSRSWYWTMKKKILCALSSRVHKHAHAYCHLFSITFHTDNGSWAQRGRVECVVWPSTQMSMLHCGESGEKERETLRDRRVKWNLTVFVNHRENAVCVCQGESERWWERRRQRERDWRRVCSCSIVTNSRLLFILACDSQQPPHIRCEIGAGEEG